MREIRNLIRNYLKSLYPRVYYQEAPSNAEYPHIVFELGDGIDDGEGHQLIPVDIDGWDKPNKFGDNTALDDLMDLINGNSDFENPTGLNKRTLTTDDFVVSFYLDRKIPLIDDDRRIKRRKYVYEARLFERS